MCFENITVPAEHQARQSRSNSLKTSVSVADARPSGRTNDSPVTQIFASWIEVARDALKGKSVVSFGPGSALMGLAATEAGAKTVTSAILPDTHAAVQDIIEQAGGCVDTIVASEILCDLTLERSRQLVATLRAFAQAGRGVDSTAQPLRFLVASQSGDYDASDDLAHKVLRLAGWVLESSTSLLDSDCVWDDASPYGRRVECFRAPLDGGLAVEDASLLCCKESERFVHEERGIDMQLIEPLSRGLASWRPLMQSFASFMCSDNEALNVAIRGKKVVEIGAVGRGLVSLVAAKLGAEKVVAVVDHADHQALPFVKHNFALNGEASACDAFVAQKIVRDLVNHVGGEVDTVLACDTLFGHRGGLGRDLVDAMTEVAKRRKEPVRVLAASQFDWTTSTDEARGALREAGWTLEWTKSLIEFDGLWDDASCYARYVECFRSPVA